jgi:hypothetical protein
MRGCTIIFRRRSLQRAFLFALIPGLLFGPSLSRAQPPGPPESPATPKKEESGLFDQSSPYLEYGDFNMNEEEVEDTNYFQYGKFFGLSLGLGYQTATGNRGKFYSSAIPRFDGRIQYWFNFNFAAELGVFFANHSFSDGTQTYQVKMIGYGFGLKYYFDTKNASAAISFANPFLSGGAGALNKTQTSTQSVNPEADSTFSAHFGGGLEFPVSFKKTYLSVEALYHTQNFLDTNDTYNRDVAPDLTGGFFTLMLQFMFVW